MKTKNFTSISICFMASFLMILCLQITAANTESYKTIRGTVIDTYSNKSISHATISAGKTNISTVTNDDGFFALKINNSLDVKSLEIHHVGYKTQTIHINNDKDQEINIRLVPNTKNLDELVIELKSPSVIVKEAFNKIADNNRAKSNLLRGFYRETVKKRSTYSSISEAVINVYKSSYTNNVDKDAVQVLKGRTLLSPKLTDTIAVKVQGGPNITKYLDFVKNKDMILDEDMINLYTYKLDGYVNIEDRIHYIISFNPSVSTQNALYFGQLFIDRESLTISRVELNLDISDKKKASNAVLIKKPYKMRFQVNSLSSVIVYKQSNGKSYLNYVKSEIQFKCNWKKLFYIFAPTYTVTSEAVITDRLEDNVKRIASKDIFSQSQNLSDRIENFFDPDFWKAYNIIEPTESLEAAIDKLKKK